MTRFQSKGFICLPDDLQVHWAGFCLTGKHIFCPRGKDFRGWRRILIVRGGNFLRWNLHNRGITVQMMSFVYKILFYVDKVFAKDVKVLYNMKHRYSSTAKGQEPG